MPAAAGRTVVRDVLAQARVSPEIVSRSVVRELILFRVQELVKLLSSDGLLFTVPPLFRVRDLDALFGSHFLLSLLELLSMSSHLL